MLPGVGFSEILLIGVIALLVVGPKDLPLMLRKLGRQMAKLRALAQEFRTGFDELARQAELDELKREVDALRRGQILNDPVLDDVRAQMTDMAASMTSPPSPPAVPPPGSQPGNASLPATPEDPPIAPPAPELPDPVTAEPVKAAR
jgi:sec-independent protein translocase protein TatB